MLIPGGNEMKIKREWLLIAIGAIGVSMILYTLARQFLGFNLGEAFEKFFFDGVFIAAIGIFMFNRKMLSDEKKEAAEKAALEQAQAQEEEESDSGSVDDHLDSEGR
jgi:hypothetical protein